MEHLVGILGLIFLLGIAFLLSNNRKAIDRRVVLSGLGLQLFLAIFILKTTPGQKMFAFLGRGIEKILSFSEEGAKFVFGRLADFSFVGHIFFVHIMATIIFVAVLVSIAYHIGLMQQIVKIFAKAMKFIMNVSGSEALSNASSAFVGQVEAQILIKPYLKGMTKSELLASMTGSMACIAGGVMAIYIGMGVPAHYLLAASVMAAPAALVVSKIVFPETEESQTRGEVKLEVKQTSSNIMDAISHGASDGMKISMNVFAMLIGVIALIALINYGLGKIDPNLSLKAILGVIFYPVAWLMGVPYNDCSHVASLMGQKMAINEFVAYQDMTDNYTWMNAKSTMIASFALCGFANFSSIAIQLGGIGELVPERRSDIAKLGFKAMICGTIASYMSATLAGLLFYLPNLF